MEPLDEHFEYVLMRSNLRALALQMRAEGTSNVRIGKEGSPLTSMAEEIHLGQLGEYQLEIAKKILAITDRG